jgi:hypothetical protein
MLNIQREDTDRFVGTVYQLASGVGAEQPPINIDLGSGYVPYKPFYSTKNTKSYHEVIFNLGTGFRFPNGFEFRLPQEIPENTQDLSTDPDVYRYWQA